MNQRVMMRLPPAEEKFDGILTRFDCNTRL